MSRQFAPPVAQAIAYSPALSEMTVVHSIAIFGPPADAGKLHLPNGFGPIGRSKQAPSHNRFGRIHLCAIAIPPAYFGFIDRVSLLRRIGPKYPGELGLHVG